jgi:hypothetical protein
MPETGFGRKASFSQLERCAADSFTMIQQS